MRLRRIVGVCVVLLTLALPALGCGADSNGAQRRNEELMASLPVFPEAALVRTYTSAPPGGPILWHEFASAASPVAVAGFYEQELPGSGWQHTEEDRSLTFRRDGVTLTVYIWGHDPPGFQRAFTQVATPPTGTVHRFVLRMGGE